MKKFTIQFIILTIIIFAALAYATSKIPELPFVPKQIKLKQMEIRNLTLNVEVVDSPERRRLGLGGRQLLASNSGMLFIFDKPDVYKFWMKEMKFAVDIIWIRLGIVVDITKNVPPPVRGQSDASLPKYSPSQPADMVLEVVSGFADLHSLQIGDKLKIR